MVRFSEHLFYYQKEQYFQNMHLEKLLSHMTTQFLRMPNVEYFYSPELLSVNQLLSGLWKIFALDLTILQILLSNLSLDFLEENYT